jgi:hypothetical protein
LSSHEMILGHYRSKVLQLLSLAKGFFIHVSIIHDNNPL